MVSLPLITNCAQLRIERSGFEPWPVTLRSVLRQDTTLTVPLSTQLYKRVRPANVMLKGNVTMDWHPIQGGKEILLVISYYRNRDKLRPDGPFCSYYYTDSFLFAFQIS